MRSMLIGAVLAAASGLLLPQNAPIKMGLWEKTMVTTNGADAPSTMKAKSCVTPATWQEMVANASKQHEGCTINSVKTAHGYTFTGSCTMPHVTMVMNGSSTVQDSEHIGSESHTTMTMNGQKKQVDSHSMSRFLGADCGNVKPGEPEIEGK
jgi:hypothetical protein